MMTNNSLFALWTENSKATCSGFNINSFTKDFNLDFHKLIKQEYLKDATPSKKQLWNELQENRALLSYGFDSAEKRDSVASIVTDTERKILSDLNIDLTRFFNENYNTRTLSK